MIERNIHSTVVAARVVRVENAKYKVILLTHRIGEQDEPIAWDLPESSVYPSSDDAEKSARIVLLGISGIAGDGRPVLSVC